MRIIFYVTDRRDIDFVDEVGVSQLGELCIDIGKKNIYIYMNYYNKYKIIISPRKTILICRG